MQDITVLIVDDEKNIRTVLETELAGYGFGTAAAASGAAALELLEQQEFDVVLLDLNMPGHGRASRCCGRYGRAKCRSKCSS